MNLSSLVLLVCGASVPSAAQDLRLRELPRRMLPGEGDEARALVLGDVDGNGAVDFLVGNRNGLARTRLALNDGHGVFGDSGTVFPGDVDWTTAAGLGDVDSDGDLDAFLGKTTRDLPDPPTSDGGAQNRLYLNGGAGVFVDGTVDLPVLLDKTSGVELADFDGDGNLDALLGGTSANPSAGVYLRGDRLLLGNGNGAFVDGPALPGSSQLAGTLSGVADVDADGDLDALYRKGSCCANLVLLLNDGAGTFTSASGAVPALSDNGLFLLEDVDGDGDPDAFSGEHFYRNDGTGLFSDDSSGVPALPTALTDLALADADGDGDLDALFGRAFVFPTGHSNLLYRGDGDGGFVLAGDFPVDGDDTRKVALADVDGDGDADALFANAGQERLYLGRGDGTFFDTDSHVPFARQADVTGAAARDFTGDGELDLYLACSGQNALYRGDGAGGFVDVSTQLPVLDDPSASVTAADVDGDGDMDVVIGNEDSPAIDLSYLARNDGAGGFSVDAAALPPFADQVKDVALGDLDGDGDADAVVGNAQLQRKRVLLNGGTGLFSDAPANIDAVTEIEEDLELADLDGDGVLDLVVGGNGTGRIYENDGLGVLTQRLTIGSDEAVATGDIDLDGDTDLFLGGDSLRRNLGNFSFQSRNLPQTPDKTTCAVLTDFDGDGDVDILLGTGGTLDNDGSAPFDQLHHLENGGSGTFTLADSALEPQPTEWTNALAVADYDRDGDQDVVAAGFDSCRLFSNLTRHVAARGLPRAGQPLALELYGAPGQRWVLQGVLPGSGRSAALQRIGFLDAEGRATFVMPVPDSPGVVGRTLLWHARIGGGWSNFERTTITDL